MQSAESTGYTRSDACRTDACADARADAGAPDARAHVCTHAGTHAAEAALVHAIRLAVQNMRHTRRLLPG